MIIGYIYVKRPILWKRSEIKFKKKPKNPENILREAVNDTGKKITNTAYIAETGKQMARFR